MKIRLDLKEKQKKAFLKLRAAYKACEKAGIFFVNNYGNLEAYDKSIVADYADDSTYTEDDEDILSTSDFYCANTMNIANEWTDDKHLIKLTAKGVKQLKNET